MSILKIVDLNDVVRRHKNYIERIRRELEEAIAELAPEKAPWLSPAIRDSKKYTLMEKARTKIAMLKNDCRNNLLAAKEHNITNSVDFESWTEEHFAEMREFREKEVYTLTADL